MSFYTNSLFYLESRQCGMIVSTPVLPSPQKSTSQYLPTLPQKVISEQWRSPLGFCIPATYSSIAGFLPKKELIQLLLYCANYIHNPLKICNVCNGSHYQWLLQHHVIINSKKQLYQYFLDRRNLAFQALALCLSSILQEAQWPISYANIVGKL